MRGHENAETDGRHVEALWKSMKFLFNIKEIFTEVRRKTCQIKSKYTVFSHAYVVWSSLWL